MTVRVEVCPGQLYKHYKGDVYLVLHVGNHTETMDRMVVYRKITERHYGTPVWVRPLVMFMSLVEVNGKLVERFSLTQNILPLHSLPLG